MKYASSIPASMTLGHWVYSYKNVCVQHNTCRLTFALYNCTPYYCKIHYHPDPALGRQNPTETSRQRRKTWPPTCSYANRRRAAWRIKTGRGPRTCEKPGPMKKNTSETLSTCPMGHVSARQSMVVSSYFVSWASWCSRTQPAGAALNYPALSGPWSREGGLSGLSRCACPLSSGAKCTPHTVVASSALNFLGIFDSGKKVESVVPKLGLLNLLQFMAPFLE